ncbi:hypothetical protein LguiB_028269 [Lonicera macranthoides]
MALIPSSFFGGQRSNVFDPFSLDIWDPFQGFPFSSNTVANVPSSARETSAIADTRIDWKETPETHVFKADLPGVKKEEVKVEVEVEEFLRSAERGAKSKRKRMMGGGGDGGGRGGGGGGEEIIRADDASERFSRAHEISCRYARGVPSCPVAAAEPSEAAQTSQQVTQADGPPDSAQESPVLPLVLPLPSDHSTTGSTGPSPPTRSIRCSFATTHVSTDTDTAAGASSSNKRRGVVLGKKTAAITKEKGRTPVTYEDSIRGPPFSVRSRFVTDLSAYIKDRCPMLHPTWHDLPVTERTRLLDFLSGAHWLDKREGRQPVQAVEVFLSHELAGIGRYAPSGRVRTSACGVAVRRSEQMKAIRASTNKRPHSGGAKPFAARAEEYTKKGEQAPHAKTYIDMYKKFDPEGTSWVQQASDEAVASLMESMPPIEDTSDGTSPASVTAPPRLSVDVEIGLMERVVGPSRRTRVPGLGSGVAKQPMTRGPSRPEPRNASIKEEFARLRANQKELEERLQQERRDRQERESQLERERHERESQLERERQDRDRERLEFEARVQAQLAEMARQMNMRAPPSDGSNA